MFTTPEIPNLPLFISASLVLLIIPGPAVLYIIGKSMDQGLKAGLVSVLGIGIGSLVHVIAASVGISAILVTSSIAFMALKYLGALYLVYLGVQTFLRKESNLPAESGMTKPKLSKVFTQGVIVNVFNPKTALFFFAFLPQFVDPKAGSVTIQILLLGFIFSLLAITTDSIYALLSDRLSGYLKGNVVFKKIQKYVVGSIYFALGLLTLATSGDGTKQ